VVHEPHGDFGNADGPFADFDSVEGVHVHEEEVSECRGPLGTAVKGLEDVDLQQAELAVGDERGSCRSRRPVKEVSAAIRS